MPFERTNPTVPGRKPDFETPLLDDEFKDKGGPKFYEALDRRDWAGAADESHRRDVSEERNQAIRDWLLESDQEEKR